MYYLQDFQSVFNWQGAYKKELTDHNRYADPVAIVFVEQQSSFDAIISFRNFVNMSVSNALKHIYYIFHFQSVFNWQGASKKELAEHHWYADPVAIAFVERQPSFDAIVSFRNFVSMPVSNVLKRIYYLQDFQSVFNWSDTVGKELA